VLGIFAVCVDLATRHHGVLHPHKARERAYLLRSRRVVPYSFLLPACPSRCRIDQKFR
jgi:hypothetical protein